MLGSGAMVVMAEGTDLLAAGDERAALLPQRVVRQVRAVPRRAPRRRTRSSATCSSGASGVDDVDERIAELEETLRLTSICGLGQVALGPVLSVLGMERGGAAAREHPKSVAATETCSREAGAADGVPHRHDGGRGARGLPARPGARRSAVALAGARPRAGRPVARADGAARLRARRPSTATPCGRPTPTARPRGCPASSSVTGAVRDGPRAGGEVGPGAAVAIPTGGLLPHGADAVVMVEHTTEPMPGHVELDAPGRAGRRRAARRRGGAAGDELVPAGRPLRAADLGPARRGGRDRGRAHARPRVAIVSTGDEVVPPGTAELGARPGARRLRAGARRPGRARPAASRCCAASCRTTRDALEHVLAAAVAEDDVVVVSAGSSVGARDLTATVVARLGRAGIWPRPRDQARQADAARRLRRRAARRPAGQPALGARRLPARRRAARARGRRHHQPAAGAVGARPARRATCRARGAARRRAGRACTTAPPRRCSAPRRCSVRWSRADGWFVACRRRPPASAPGPRSRSRLYG